MIWEKILEKYGSDDMEWMGKCRLEFMMGSVR